MHSTHPIRWLTEPPKLGRQYAFGRRGDRRRIAQRLAAGWGVEQTALVERADGGALRQLLRDDGFARLVAYYQELMALDEDAQLRRMSELASAIIIDALQAGDIRVATFVFDQRLKRRHPGRTVGEAVLRSLERATTPPAEPTPPERARDPHAAELRVASEGRPRREDEFPYCAAVQPCPEAAEKLAVEEAARVCQSLQATVTRLKAQIMTESEREGTIAIEPALVPDDQALAHATVAFARAAHFAPGQAFEAGHRLWERRDRKEEAPTDFVPGAGTLSQGPAAGTAPAAAAAGPAPLPAEADDRETPLPPQAPAPSTRATNCTQPDRPTRKPPDTVQGLFPPWYRYLPPEQRVKCLNLRSPELEQWFARMAVVYDLPWPPDPDPPDRS